MQRERGLTTLFLINNHIETMKTRYIQIGKTPDNKIQYLRDILPEIPTNTILYKKLTGLGATYGEIKANRNSIIVEPNVPVIIGKCNDSKHKEDNLFGIYEGIYTDDIIKYLEKSKNKYYKILTTCLLYTSPSPRDTR